MLAKIMNDTNYIKFTTALEKKTYTELVLKRNDDDCYLLIEIDGELHVNVDKNGNQKKYKKIKQIKDWLLNTYKITDSEYTVQITKNPK